jgi:cupin fold WbuC family metalloprotein
MNSELKQINKEIYYFKNDVVKIGPEIVDFLKEKAHENESGKCRVCCHPDETALHHDMIIVHTKEAHVRPHRHKTRVESFYIIEGKADILLYDKEGELVDRISLGDTNSGLPFYYRLNDSIFHSLDIHTDDLVFHETTNGPFNKEDTVFPSWG